MFQRSLQPLPAPVADGAFFLCAKSDGPVPVASALGRMALIQAALDPDIASISPPPLLFDGAHGGLTAVLTGVDGLRAAILIDGDGDAFADKTPDDIRSAAAGHGLAFRLLGRADVEAEPFHSNARQVWCCRRRFVPAGDLVRVLHFLSENGASPLIEAAQAATGSRDGVETVLALACRDRVEISLRERLLGPETPVRIRQRD